MLLTWLGELGHVGKYYFPRGQFRTPWTIHCTSWHLPATGSVTMFLGGRPSRCWPNCTPPPSMSTMVLAKKTTRSHYVKLVWSSINHPWLAMVSDIVVPKFINFLAGNSIQNHIGKTMSHTPPPIFTTFYRWYGYHSKSWVVCHWFFAHVHPFSPRIFPAWLLGFRHEHHFGAIRCRTQTQLAIALDLGDSDGFSDSSPKKIGNTYVNQWLQGKILAGTPRRGKSMGKISRGFRDFPANPLSDEFTSIFESLHLSMGYGQYDILGYVCISSLKKNSFVPGSVVSYCLFKSIFTS